MGHDTEHPIVAWAGIIAVLAAMLLIAWARVQVHGTADIEAVLDETPVPNHRSWTEREVDRAVTTGRFATGLSP